MFTELSSSLNFNNTVNVIEKRKDLFSSTASNIQIREKIYKYNNKKYNVYKKHLRIFEKEYEWLK